MKINADDCDFNELGEIGNYPKPFQIVVSIDKYDANRNEGEENRFYIWIEINDRKGTDGEKYCE